jgi:hypothetical protein
MIKAVRTAVLIEPPRAAEKQKSPAAITSSLPDFVVRPLLPNDEIIKTVRKARQAVFAGRR